MPWFLLHVCACVRESVYVCVEYVCISHSSIPIHIRVCLSVCGVFVCVCVRACARNARVYLVHPYPFISVSVDAYPFIHESVCHGSSYMVGCLCVCMCTRARGMLVYISFIHIHSYTCLSIHTIHMLVCRYIPIHIRVCRYIPIHTYVSVCCPFLYVSVDAYPFIYVSSLLE